MTNPNAYEAMARDLIKRDVSPAFAGVLLACGRIQRAAEKNSDEYRSAEKVVEIWGQTFEFFSGKVREEFPNIRDTWETLRQYREKWGLDHD